MSTTNQDETKETIISSIITEEEEEQKSKNYLEEYELINDSFPDEDPQ
jgi:hypothetical protein